MATAILAVTTAMAGLANASHAWGGYHWARTSNPFTLAVGDNVSSAWDGYLDRSIGEWSQSTVLDLVKVAGGTTGKLCRATLGRVEVCSASYGRNGWLGLASISITGGTHITQGTVKVNDTYFARAQYTPDARRRDAPGDRPHLRPRPHQRGRLHPEHLHGLLAEPHQLRAERPRLRGAGDHLLPPRLDHHGRLRQRRPVPQVGNDRSSWGREVDRSADGSHSTFIRDFGHGKLVITDVTRAN